MTILESFLTYNNYFKISNPQHIVNRNMFCHGNDKGYLSFYGFFNGLGRLISRHVDCRRIWFCYLLSLESVNKSIDYHTEYSVQRWLIYIQCALMGISEAQDARLPLRASRLLRSWFPILRTLLRLQLPWTKS